MTEEKHCTTRAHEHATDRAECNACARVWNASGYTHYVHWQPKVPQ